MEGTTVTRRDEIRARLDAATPHRWEMASTDSGPFDYEVHTVADDSWSLIGLVPSPRDADLIAHAPDDLLFLLAEVERLHLVLGPDYHVVDIRADGWSIQHPIPCRDSMLDCELHRIAAHWQEPPAPVGRYRADLTNGRRIALTHLDEVTGGEQ